MVRKRYIEEYKHHLLELAESFFATLESELLNLVPLFANTEAAKLVFPNF